VRSEVQILSPRLLYLMGVRQVELPSVANPLSPTLITQAGHPAIRAIAIWTSLCSSDHTFPRSQRRFLEEELATGMHANALRNCRTSFATLRVQAYSAIDPLFDVITRDHLIDFFTDSGTPSPSPTCATKATCSPCRRRWNLLIPRGDGKALPRASEKYGIMDATRFQGELKKRS
jgi:hypothetical protein